MVFLGFPFAPIAPASRAPIADLLARHPQSLSDYTFASLSVWSSVFDYRYALVEPDTVLFMSHEGPDRQAALLQPVGRFSPKVQADLLAHARELPYPLAIQSVGDEFLARHPEFVAHFHVETHRDHANYVYAAKDLAELAGRRFAKKRNLIEQASRLHAWQVEPLGPQHVRECLEIGDDIAAKRTTLTLQQESLALASAVSRFEELGLSGLLLHAEGGPAAFSIFDCLSSTTAVVLFERALRSKKGFYQVINRETARVLAARGISFINREEDLGDPGLRRAKLSYYPSRLENKHTLTLRR